MLARPIARTNVGLYAQMVGRGLRLYPGKASCKVIDCVGVSNMPICTAATLIGKDVPAPKPEKEPTEKLPEEQDPIKVLEGNEIPDSWIKNQKEVNVMALGEGYTTHDVAWLDVKGGGRILPLPNVVYRISKPLPNGMVYLRKNKKCSRCAVPLQFVLDYVYQDLKQNHPQQQHIWDKKQRYKWDRQPITSEQISLIHKLAPDYKIGHQKDDPRGCFPRDSAFGVRPQRAGRTRASPGGAGRCHVKRVNGLLPGATILWGAVSTMQQFTTMMPTT